jgi:hypothetical protein
METNELKMDTVPEAVRQSGEFGVIVNDLPSAPTEWDDRVKEIEAPLEITLTLPTSLVTRLKRVADDSGQSLDEWTTALVMESLEGKVGQSSIKTPSWAKGPKVKGYTGSVTRVDNHG